MATKQQYIAVVDHLSRMVPYGLPCSIERHESTMSFVISFGKYLWYTIFEDDIGEFSPYTVVYLTFINPSDMSDQVSKILTLKDMFEDFDGMKNIYQRNQLHTIIVHADLKYNDGQMLGIYPGNEDISWIFG